MLRFSIRDVLWLTVVVAMAAALIVERNRAALADRGARRHSGQAMHSDAIVRHLLRLWEQDNPGAVTLESPGSALYVVQTKTGRVHFPLRISTEEELVEREKFLRAKYASEAAGKSP